MGAFDFFKRDLKEGEFTSSLLEFFMNFYNIGGEVYILTAKTPKGPRPVGVTLVGNARGPLTRAEAEPHVQWFTWASPRNRLECALAFLIELKKRIPFRLHVEPKDAPFFYHIGKYGVLRCVGQRRHYFGWTRTAVMFESVGS